MRFYLMGICGSAMGTAALLLHRLGHVVQGSDEAARDPMQAALESAGIAFHPSYAAENLKDLSEADCIVVGNAIARGNPELEALLSRPELSFVSLPELIRTHILKRRQSIVISGTHGKTTTTALTAYLLEASGASPGWLMGGLLQSDAAIASNPSDAAKANAAAAIAASPPDASKATAAANAAASPPDARKAVANAAAARPPNAADLSNTPDAARPPNPMDASSTTAPPDASNPSDVSRANAVANAAAVSAMPLNAAVSGSLSHGAAIGEATAPFVIEGDEYDSAFFDKRAKYIHYKPDILVINNLDMDHADIFRDVRDIQRSFAHLIQLVPPTGYILYNPEDKNLGPILPVGWCHCYKVGRTHECDLRILNFKETPPAGARFELSWKRGEPLSFQSPLPGLHNARNLAQAILAAGLSLDADDPLGQLNLESLAAFKGVQARLEKIFEHGNCLVFKDFAHHPSAIEATLESLREHYPSHQIMACFEPSTHTTCSDLFQERFLSAFDLAECCYLAPLAKKPQASKALDTQALAKGLQKIGLQARAFADYPELTKALLEWAKVHSKLPRCIVFLSNGNFGNCIPECLAQLAEVASDS